MTDLLERQKEYYAQRADEYRDPGELAERVAPLGFELDLRRTGNGHFVHGGGR